MIPTFPKFKKITLEDKKEIEKIVSKLPPYSDFNFVSMWSWDIDNKISISKLNDNLVVLFTDYISGEPFLSFIGNKKPNKTSRALIEYSKKKYGKSYLKLLPEHVTKKLTSRSFNISNDLDSRDYIYRLSDMAKMDTWRGTSSHKKLSKGIRRFMRSNSDISIRQDPLQKVDPKKYYQVYKNWAYAKKLKNHLDSNEFKAFQRIFKIKDNRLRIITLKVKGKIVGFSIFELLNKRYALSHFAKGDTSHHSAVYNILNWQEARILYSSGIRYYNWEQDLGIEGLRQSKLKYRPAFFLHKYRVKDDQ